MQLSNKKRTFQKSEQRVSHSGITSSKGSLARGKGATATHTNKLFSCWEQQDNSPTVGRERNYMCNPNYHIFRKMYASVRSCAKGRSKTAYIQTHALWRRWWSAWKFFFWTAGEESISFSLAGRQGAMSTLIMSVCSTKTHVWTCPLSLLL